ncbi:MAG: hypothetical protein ACI4D2_00460 [Lachnospiraceae bacterium]
MNSIKKLNELTIRDNFLFAAVMQQGDNCKRFLEMLLGIKVERIHNIALKACVWRIRVCIWQTGAEAFS